MIFRNQIREWVIGRLRPWRPVGTGGGCGEGWGPCACPRGITIRSDFLRQKDHGPTRTGTRPPHPLRPSPCPYRWVASVSEDYPFRVYMFIRIYHPVCSSQIVSSGKAAREYAS